MAVVIAKSTVITNRDASPKVLSGPDLSGGEVRESQGYASANNNDSAGSTYVLCTVPSNCRISSLVLQAGALGSGAALDIGVWYPTFIPLGSGLSSSNASTVINTTLFASALGCSAATAATELITPANLAQNKQEQQLWQAAGLATDPAISLDIVARVNVATATAGYVGLKAKYVE